MIRELHTGELTTWEGDYFRIDSAPDLGCPRRAGCRLAIAVSGQKSIERFAPLADHLVAVEPDPELIKDWDKAKGTKRSRKIAPDSHLLGTRSGCRHGKGAPAVPLVRRRFRGQRRSAEPGRLSGGESVRPTRGRGRDHPLRAGVDAIAEGVGKYVDAGFTDIAVVQVGTRARPSSWSRRPARC